MEWGVSWDDPQKTAKFLVAVVLRPWEMIILHHIFSIVFLVLGSMITVLSFLSITRWQMLVGVCRC